MLTLIPLRLSHASAFVRASRDESFLKGLRYKKHQSYWQAVRSIFRTRKTALTIVVDGKIAGRIGHRFEEGKPVLFYWIYPAFQGRGYASSALRTYLAMHPLSFIAYEKTWNEASKRVLEKNGMRYVHDKDDYLVYTLESPKPKTAFSC